MKLYIILLFLTSSTCLVGQRVDLEKVDWLSMGIGYGGKNHATYFISYTWVNESVFQLSYNCHFRSYFFGGSYDETHSASISYGWLTYSKWFFGNLAIGPALTYTDHNNSKSEYGYGVNVNGQYFWAASDVMGFGVDVFGNVNNIRNIYGARFSLFFKSIK